MRQAILGLMAFLFGCGADITGSGGGSDGGVSATCSDSRDCADGLICAPDQTCQPASACASDAECTGGAICGSTGVCQANVPGGRCAGPENCVTNEVCDDGQCVAVGENGCVPSDLVIVLDRTGSMSQRPDGTLPSNTPQGRLETKWHFAVTSIETVTANLQDGIRFGLALFPRDLDDFAGAGDCSNLGTWLEEFLPPETNNPNCEPGELAVAPKLDAAADIDAVLSVEGTGLCYSTPIGSGLEAARAQLATSTSTLRAQYVLLITDGDDNCDGTGGYPTNSRATAKALSAAGVNTYVVGFDGSGDGIDEGQLNQLACAGGTAPNFMDNCQDDGSGGFDARPSNQRVDDRLFLLAESAAALQTALDEIGAELCCNCGGID